MKRGLLLILVFAGAVGIGAWPKSPPVVSTTASSAKSGPPGAAQPQDIAWKSAEQAAAELPNLAQALALPAGAAQEEALLLALLNLPRDQLSSALSLLLPSARSGLAGMIVEQWAAQDPAAAAAFGNSPQGWTWLHSEHGGSLQQGLFTGLLTTQEQAAIALARRLESPHALNILFNAMLKKDPAQAMAWAEQEPGFDAAGLNKCDLQLASQVATLPAGRMKEKLLRSAFQNLHADAFGQPEKLDALMGWWQGLDVVDQATAIAENFSDPANVRESRNFAEKLSATDIERLQSAITTDPKLLNDANIVNAVAMLHGASDPAAALAWATDALQGKTRADALTNILAASAPDQLEHLTPFLDSIPPGPLRDQAAAAALESCQHVLPENLARWAEKRTDPGERKALLAPAISRWGDEDPAGAARFIIGEIPPERQVHLTQKVIARLPSLDDQLTFAARLPESIATNALTNAWQLFPPDPTTAQKAARALPAGRLRDVLLQVSEPPPAG